MRPIAADATRRSTFPSWTSEREGTTTRAAREQVLKRAPALRLRWLVLVASLVLLVAALVPRVRSAWELQSAAAAFANYALCMVGPTGPSLLRDRPAEFAKLARRRLITSSATDHPFSRCAKLAREAGAPDAAPAHEASAWLFVEYGGDAADGIGPRVTIAELAVTTHHLAELADRAWPFVRGGYTSLVQPSAYAPEAAHPAELPRPTISRGVSVDRPLLAGGRCPAGSNGAAFALGLSSDRRFRVARSSSRGGVESNAPFAPANARVIATACDESTLVIAVGRPGTRDIALVTCAPLGNCAPMKLPELGAGGPKARYPIDVARVLGVTVIATPMHGIVRVASTRDDGRTWTPFTVAYDPEAYPALHFDIPVPDRLVVVGSRLALVAAPASPSATFPLLFSDDEGASFH